MKKKILFTLISVLLPLSLWAQESHWQCNPGDFEYDMTVIVSLELDEATITDLSNYEIAAFCGNECRGVVTAADILNAEGTQIGYLRVRSNKSSGETITFKVYDKTEQKELNVQNTKITFSNNATQGTGSAPFKLDITQRYTLGDVNGDGRINATDVRLLINRRFNRTMPAGFIEEACDINGDGRINATDVRLIINLRFNR
ncbi:MAG: hypothetical protein IJQ38_03735 [Bacteroidaceae bacterium]|nr:hypothetical protein [Bacteroidaceae bacterium]